MSSGPPLPVPARRPGSRHWLPFILVVLLAVSIVVPPLFNIERYQRRIAQNISRSLGRPAHFSHIALHLLPRPGFDLTDFTVEEGPGFGEEPILHSSSVTASVRMLSLWRGRLEIARISLDEPSLNLVRNAAGKWNFASIMTQASRTEIAPTGQTAPGRSLRFPYIEATNARINFKYGDEKQPFSFLNGDFSAWLENPEEWQLRFAAEPTRTDLDHFASNTGLVRIEGSMKRAAALGEIPLNLRAEWTHAPLGQIGRLFDGFDTGWRGELGIRSRLTGTPDQLLLNTTLTVDDLHRAEFAPDNMLSYSAKCSGTYLKADEQLTDLRCLMPVGSGSVAVTGALANATAVSGSHLDLMLAGVPASTGLDVLRIVREHTAKDLTIAGQVSGQFQLGWTPGHTSVSGVATTDALSMNAPSMARPLVLGSLRLSALDGAGVVPGSGKVRGGRLIAPAIPASLLLAPLKLDLGSPSPLLVDGRFNRQGYLLHFGGRGQLARLIPAVESFGLNLPGFQALQPAGDAGLDVQLRGPWLLPMDTFLEGHPGDATRSQISSAPTGTMTVRDATLKTSYMAAPLILKSAQASLSETQIAWSGIVAQYGPVHFTGTFRVPLHCGTGAACTRQFDLTVPTLNIAALPGVLLGKDPLMRELISRIEDSAAWPSLHGTVRAANATLGTLQLEDAVASLDIDGARVKLESVDAKALEGSLHMTGTLDAGTSPAYHLDAQLNQASIEALGDLFGQSWGTGSINVATHVNLSGLTRDELTSSSKGMFHFDWIHGGLHAETPKVTTSVHSPFLHFDEWTADGQIQNAGFTLEQSLLTAQSGTQAVQGTIGFGAQLDLRATTASGTDGAASAQPENEMITGTLAAPEFSDAASNP